jgi:hypothetical protein
MRSLLFLEIESSETHESFFEKKGRIGNQIPVNTL